MFEVSELKSRRIFFLKLLMGSDTAEFFKKAVRSQSEGFLASFRKIPISFPEGLCDLKNPAVN